LDLRRLNLLRELRDQGTLVAVAKALNYSPSALSQQLAQLQSEVGVRLVERRGRKLQLTQAGRRLAEDSEAIFEQLERARTHVEAFKSGIGGTIRVAAFQTAASVAIPRALTELASDANLRVEVLELEPEASLPLLARGGIDLVVGQEYDQAPRSVHPGISRRFERDEPVLIALPLTDPLAGRRRPLRLAALADRAWASGHADTAYGQALLRAARNAGFEPDIRYRSNDVTVFLSLVADGHAVALVPSLSLASPARPLVSLHQAVDVHIARRIFTAVRRGDGQRPALRRVRAAIAAGLGEAMTSATAPRPA
jgi:DNA-binding transcriptional LysR family regulator